MRAANPNALLLTAEDCMFLLEVGIRPRERSAPLVKEIDEIPAREDSERFGTEAGLQTQLNLRDVVF